MVLCSFACGFSNGRQFRLNCSIVLSSFKPKSRPQPRPRLQRQRQPHATKNIVTAKAVRDLRDYYAAYTLNADTHTEVLKNEHEKLKWLSTASFLELILDLAGEARRREDGLKRWVARWLPARSHKRSMARRRLADVSVVVSAKLVAEVVCEIDERRLLSGSGGKSDDSADGRYRWDVSQSRGSILVLRDEVGGVPDLAASSSRDFEEEAPPPYQDEGAIANEKAEEVLRKNELK